MHADYIFKQFDKHHHPMSKLRSDRVFGNIFKHGHIYFTKRETSSYRPRSYRDESPRSAALAFLFGGIHVNGSSERPTTYSSTITQNMHFSEARSVKNLAQSATKNNMIIPENVG